MERTFWRQSDRCSVAKISMHFIQLLDCIRPAEEVVSLLHKNGKLIIGRFHALFVDVHLNKSTCRPVYDCEVPVCVSLFNFRIV